MTIIHQTSLFGIQELYDLEPTQKYQEIISTLDLDAVYYAVTKKSHLGAPEALNYGAILVSIVVWLVERIPTIKDLIKRLRDDLVFKLNCGFRVSDAIPSEASYSRLVTKLTTGDVLEIQHEQIVCQAIEEGFIRDDTAAIDACHFEARDQAPLKEVKPTAEPKKRGRKSKAERAQWLKEQAELEAVRPVYEKKIEAQLEVP